MIIPILYLTIMSLIIVKVMLKQLTLLIAVALEKEGQF